MSRPPARRYDGRMDHGRLVRGLITISMAALLACNGGTGETSDTGSDTTASTTNPTDATSDSTNPSSSSSSSTSTTTMGPTTSTTDGTASTTDDPTTTTTTTTGTSGVTVPEPCATVNELFIFETEPNDTPETASDACTVDGGYWGTFFPNEPMVPLLGGGDLVDYYVFRTVPAAQDLQIQILPCWFANLDLIDLTVYEAVDGEPLTVVYESSTPDTFCEGDFVLLAPDTKFLLELRVPDEPGPPVTEYYW